MIVLFGTVLSMAAGFLFRLLLAQYTSPEILGTVVIFLSLLNTGSTVCLLGLHRGVVKFISEYEGFNPERNSYISIAVATTIAVSVVLGAVIVQFGPSVRRLLFKSADFEGVIYLFILALPFFSLLKVIGATLQGSMNSSVYVLFSKILKPGLKLLLPFLAVLWIGSTTAIVTALALSFMTTAIVGFWLLYRDGWRPALHRSVDVRRFYVFSVPLMIASSVYILLTQFDKLLLGYFISPAAVGRYEVAYTISNLLGVFNSAFSFLLFPKISSLLSAGRESEIEPLYQQATKWILLLTTPLFLVLVFRPMIVISVFGPEYSSSMVMTTLSVLAVGFFVKAVLGPNSEALLGLDRSWAVLSYNVIAVASNVILNILLIPRYGLLGAAVASVCGFTTMNILKSVDLYITHDIVSINLDAITVSGIVVIVGVVLIQLLPQAPSLLLEGVMVSIAVGFSLIVGVIWLYYSDAISEADKELLSRLVSSLPLSSG